MTQNETSVLIVGAGPVGLALANELSYRGADYILIEQGEGKIFFPAGENIFSRTMEHLRRWGIASELRNSNAFPPDYPRNIGFCTRVGGWPLALFPGTSNGDAPTSDVFSPEGGLFYPKKAFDPALRKAAEAKGGDLRYGHRLVSFYQDADAVICTVESLSDGQSYTIRTKYLAGCDGPRSLVRKALDIKYVGTFGEGFNFAVYFRCAGLGERLRSMFTVDMAQVHTVCDENRAYLTSVDGRDEWRFSMYTETTKTYDPSDVVAKAIGSGLDFDVLQAQPWTGHRVVAERYRAGRVFLVGDANHLRWPKGGFGANTGIGDAVDLGWKLDACLKGWGGEVLLDSYQAERRNIAIRNTNEAANNRVFDHMIQPDPILERNDQAGKDARQAMKERLFAFRQREFTTLGIQLGYRYNASPICVADGSLEPPDDHMLYFPSTRPGGRAPHVRLSDGRSTLDLFGKGFVLLVCDDNMDGDTLIGEAERLGIPATQHRLTEHDARKAYEMPLVLVRPDGHVCWRGETVPENLRDVWKIVTGGAQLGGTNSREPGTAFAA